MHHLVGNAEEAEDLAQEVFLRVYRSRKKYSPAGQVLDLAVHDRQQPRPERPAEPAAASRSCRWRLRESGPLGAAAGRAAGAATAGRPPSLGDAAGRNWPTSSALRSTTLNERQQMAVVLNKFEDMNYAEIAEVMGLSTKAVKSLLSRARANLRDALAGYIYMDGEEVPPAEDMVTGDS